VLIMQWMQPPADARQAWLHIARFILSASLLGACFVGVACLISVQTADKSRAAGLALIGWLVRVVLFDLVLLALLVVSGGNPIERAVYPYLLLLNPVDVFRLVNLTGLGGGAGNDLLTGMTANHTYSPTVLYLVMLGWALAPFGWAALAFRRKEI
ncbi:MAG: ABC transporter permease subunit, partial [Rhodanobacter sp.]